MKYLLDTNVIIDHLRGEKSLTPEVLSAGAGLVLLPEQNFVMEPISQKIPKKI